MTKPHEELAAADWAGEIGLRWLANLDRFEGMNASIGRALVERAGFRPGETVLDVGCGGGETSRTIAARVAPGRVTGLDISRELVDEATRRARAAGTPNVGFVAGDAAVVRPPDAPFDRLFSRFGVMFFPEPVAAFKNLASLLKPGGRADFVVWGPPAQNPWMAGVVAILRQHIALPPPVPRAPGPFAFEDDTYLRKVLSTAGFTEVAIDAFDDVVHVGGPGSHPAAAAQFVLSTMTFADAIRELPPPAQAAVTGGVTALFAGHLTTHGVVMPARTLMIRATRGADA
jgi:ubiquinone/menaquinone biosynthesis C-methylase UbiE